MRVKNIIIFALLLWASGCQIPYEAEIDEKTGLLSVEGSVVKGDSIQTIIISRSTSLYTPHFDPVNGCVIIVEDELGNTFSFQGKDDGVYKAEISQDDLVYGRNYRLVIITPDGKRYESDHEQLNKGAPVDSVYAIREQKYNAGDDEELDGVQFYLDLKGSESDSRYYRWGLTETWEYNSISYFDSIKYGELSPAAYNEDKFELFYCWKTKSIPGLYSSSTVNLTSNQKKKIPLHYVSGKTDRLGVKYSVLVEQYSLNEGAYNYWNRTKIESEDLGGLHTQQPGQTQSNITNVADINEVVLGYFWVSAKTEKRVFIKPPGGVFINKLYCEIVPVDWENASYPLYLIVLNPAGDMATSDARCLNCLLRGGTNNKPDFWD